MNHIIYNSIEHLFYSYDFSWCNLFLATKFNDEEREVFGADPASMPENSTWMTEEEAAKFEEIPWQIINVGE